MKKWLFIASFMCCIIGFAQPTITSFSPTTGGPGTIVTIKGRNLSGVTEVSFGNRPTINLQVKNDTTINATVGDGGSGFVKVSGNAGKDSLSGFVYIFGSSTAVPKIYSFSPAIGGSGTVVTIRGTAFVGTTEVSFGGFMPVSTLINNDTTITATVGAGGSGFVKVSSNSGKDSLGGFVYSSSIAAPKINSFSPAAGGSGTIVTIKGKNFIGATAVSFGNIAAGAMSVNNDSTITATVGTGASGFVKVRNNVGADSLSGFLFNVSSGVPKINSFLPITGKAGATIKITGRNFSGTTSVSFGNTPAFSYTIDNDSTLTAKVGAGASGFVRVAGALGKDSASGFIFIGPPKINSFTPLTGTTGSKITIIGKNLNKDNVVSFGNVAATSFVVNSDSSITATLGSGASGFVKVVAFNNIGITEADSAAGFIYFAPGVPKISSFTPSSAETGAVVSIKGKGFLGANLVDFGGTAASAFTVVSDSLITATVGAGSSGNVRVRVANILDSAAGFVFKVQPPEIILSDSTKNDLRFNSAKGIFSASQFFMISGKRLLSNVVVTAPANFQVSRTADSAFASSLSIVPVNNTLDSIRIYVRFRSDSIPVTTGDISITATGATPKKITVTGNLCDSLSFLVPAINGFAKDSILCMTDSVALTAGGSYNFYKWSTGDTTKTITIKKTGTISLQVGSKAGCYSGASVIVSVIKDTNPVPVLAITGDTMLVSSNANNYRWYNNNNRLGDTTHTLTVKKIGLYSVETSNDKKCWSRSNDYPIITLSLPLVNDTVSVKAYPNPSTGTFIVVGTLQRVTNAVAKVTIADVNGVILLQTNKFIFFGKEIKIPITLTNKGTVFVKLDINGDVKTQTLILQ